MVATTRWWWIRHAPCRGPAGLLQPRAAEPDLEDPRFAAALRKRLPGRALWLSSDLPRALLTVRALTHSRPLAVPALAEQDFGDWTGRTHDALWASGEPAYRAFWDDPVAALPPGGESFAALVARAQAAIEALGTEHAGMELCVVAHAGTIRAALAVALDLTPAAALRLAVDYWSLTRIDRVGTDWRVAKVNG